MKIHHLVLAVCLAAAAACKPGKSTVAAEPPAAAEASATAATPYPLETCVVSGEKLGSMGKPPELVWEGRQIKFCCKSCIPDFKEDPAKFMAKLK